MLFFCFIGRPSSPSLKVAVELRYILENTTVSNVKMGSMHVGPSVGWRMMEERLRATLLGYLAQLDVGLRTRRIARMEAEASEKDKTIGADRDFTLGLTMANIKQFEMGRYFQKLHIVCVCLPFALSVNH